jgi:hypothetical protein
MNFTLNNHLKYYIDNRLYGDRTTPYEKYTVEVGKIDPDRYKQSNWVEEQYRTAKLVSDEYKNKFVLMFSGGTDSEIVLRSFLKIGIVPRIVFIRFENDFNHADFIEAKKVCSQLGQELEVIDFDIIDFYKSGEAHELASEIQCRQIAYLAVYHHIHKLQLPAVMGGEMMFQRKTSYNYSKWYFCFRENQDGSAIRFSLKYNIPLVNEWFSYTPEMMAYYLDHHKIKWLVTEKYNYKMASFSTKNEILCEYMPELLKREKTHGYEELLAFNNETYIGLHKCYVRKLEASLDGLYVDELKNQLFGDYNGSD